MGKRRGRTGPGGAVVSSLSQNPGGKVAARRGQSSGQTEKRRAGNQKGEDEELNKLADLPSNRGAISGSSLSNDGVNRAGQSSSSSGWLGKSPQQMLREWCLKNSRKRPSFYPVVGSEGITRCVVHPGRKDGKKGSGPAFKVLVGVGDKPGDEFAALNVLHQIEHGKPLERLLAPEYRQTWLDLDKRFDEMQKHQAQRAVKKERREMFAKRSEKLEKSKGSATVHIPSSSRQMIEDALLQQKSSTNRTSEVTTPEDYSSDPNSGRSRAFRELVDMGFSEFDAMDASEIFSDTKSAVDYLCLNLDESELPASFAPKAEVEVVHFHLGTSGKGPLLDPVHKAELVRLSCLSELAVSGAMKRAGGDVCKAYSILYNTLTHSVLSADLTVTSSENLGSVVEDERAAETESIEAIYNGDASIGTGAVSIFGSKWSAVVVLPDGCPGIKFYKPISVAFVDMDGSYPLSAPVVIIDASINDGASERANMTAAERRLLMRAVAGKIASLRSLPGTEETVLEPVSVIHDVLSFLADATKEKLFNSASRKYDMTEQQVSGRMTKPYVRKGGKEQEVSKYRNVSSVISPKFDKPLRVDKLPPSSKLSEMFKQRKKLPAYIARDEILASIHHNQVTVISGATGSGKTTQVPQYLLEEATESRNPISIVCTQPRRIAAISVAERVATERCQRVGETIGYHVKLNSKKSKSTRLLFCTTGVLLRRLQSNRILQGLTHVLIDEVHERSVETDFLLLLLREILPSRPELKVVLMSATIDAKKFSTYFELNIPKKRNKGSIPILSIPGRTYPVEQLYLAEAVALSGYRLRPGDKYSRKPKVGKHMGKYGLEPDPNVEFPTLKNSASIAAVADDPTREEFFDEEVEYTSTGENVSYIPNSIDLPSIKEFSSSQDLSKATTSLIDEEQINIDLIDMLVKRVDAESRGQGSEGAILIFLPGVAEITAVIRKLSSGPGANFLWPLPLHSLLAPDDQRRVFMKAPGNARKVICSTNIAETSITVEDITVVIDTVRANEVGYDTLNGCSVLKGQFISKAAAKQRAGRAGRVSAGTCYRLVRQYTFDNRLKAQTQPEMQRVALENLVLNVMTIIPESELKGNPHKFLSKAVDPPKDEAIEKAISNLVALGALERSSTSLQSVKLTGLGKHLSRLPVDPRIGKLLIYGAMFECVDAVLTIGATLSERSPFYAPFDKRDEAREAKKVFSWGKSDLLLFLKAFNSWRNIRERGGGFSAENAFCSQHFMSRKALLAIMDGRKQLAEALADTGLCHENRLMSNRDWEKNETLNKNSENEKLVRAIICAALYPNIARVDMLQKFKKVHGGAVAVECDSKDVKLRDKNMNRLFLHPESINFFEVGYETRWLAYFNKVLTTKLFLRDSTMVSPYAILLFGGEIEVLHQQGQISVDKWIVFKSPARVGVLARELRRELDQLLSLKFEDAEMDLAATGRSVTDAIVELFTEETYQL